MIGRGSYGEVWLARGVLGELRAVKLVRHSGAADTGPAGREFDGLRKFEPVSRSHPGLVHILHAGRFDGGFHYVMELADDAADPEGGDQSNQSAAGGPVPLNTSSYAPRTLRSELQRRGRLPVSECLDLALKLTDALAHLHGHGLVHRDIKPSNIIFVGGQPKLADIGLVASVDASMTCVGTEGYLPPEGPGKPPADLYALGKMLYELATGRDRTDFPELPTLLREDPDRAALEEFNEVILKACDPDQRRRYQAAAQMRADLLLMRSGRSLRGARAMSRRLALARMASGAGAAAAALTGGGLWFQRRQTREARRLQQVAEDLAARSQIQHAEDLFARGDSALAVAHLAQVLQRHPENRIAAERLLAAFEQRCFPIPTAPPFFHADRLLAARFSPDGKWIATAARDQSARLWNALTGEAVGAPIRHAGRINVLAFSPDGNSLLTASNDRFARVWSVPAGTELFSLKHDGAVVASQFSPRGDRLATACADRQVRVFDARTGEPLLHSLPHRDPIESLAFSPDGWWLATAAQGEVCVWETSSGSLRHRLPVPGSCGLVQFSGDNRWLAAAGQHGENNNWEVWLWQPADDSPRATTLAHGHRIYALNFSPDSRRLVVAHAENRADVWEPATGRSLFKLSHAAMVYAAEFSPDGRRILTGSVDKTARLWDATTGKPIAEPMLHGGRVIHAEFSRSDDLLLTASWDQTVRTWRVSAEPPAPITMSHAACLTAAEFDATGRETLTTTSRAVFTASRINRWWMREPQGATVWDTATGGRKHSPAFPTRSGVITARFTQAGPLALIAEQSLTSEKALSADPEFALAAQVWDLAAGRPLGKTLRHSHDLTCAHFSADGRRLAVGTTRGEIRVWDVRQGAALTPPLSQAGWINSVTLSPDGSKIASTSSEGTVIIWDAVSGARLAGPLMHGSEAWSAQFSPTGDRLAVATIAHNVRIWSVTGQLLVDLPHGGLMPAMGFSPAGEIFRGACDPVEHVAFSPDGNRVVTAAGDRARVWDATTGRQLAELPHRQLVRTASFSHDGLRVITASFDQTAQLWDAATGLRLADSFRHDDIVLAACLSPDGRHTLTASWDGVAKIWKVPLADLPATPWLAKLAEAVAGQRLNADRIPEPVTWAERTALQQRLAADQGRDSSSRWALSLLVGPSER